MNSATGPALDLLRRDAACGTPESLYALATALIAQEDVEEAHGYLVTAAQAGHAGAQVQLASMYLYAVGAALDVAQAVDWLKRAEQSGHAGASYLLALVALGGISLERDFQAIGQRLLTAAKAEFVPAVRALAMYFGRERDNVASMRQSETLLAQAAARRDGVSAALLAERVRHGELVGDARYALASLDRLAAETGIKTMPSLRGVPVMAGANTRLQLDIESSLGAPPVDMRCQAPKVGVIEGLLSAEECRYVIAMGSPYLNRARVADPETGQWIRHPGRTSYDAFFVAQMEDFQLRLLQLRMAAAIGMDFTCAEPMVLLHYRPGQEYWPHRDYLPPETLAANQPEAGQRAATLCCYLNDVESGGGTSFLRAPLVIEPRTGRAVAFRNIDDTGRPDMDSHHAGLPVEKGEKWLVTLWLRERRHRDF